MSIEQRTVMISGNGIANKYGYDPKTRRLASVDAASLGTQERQLGKPATTFHQLRYWYDLVGNITKVENQSTVYTWQNASVHTGPMRTEHTYDKLCQLKSATGRYRPTPNFGYNYSSTFQYDEIGNLVQKAQLEDRITWENQDPPAGVAALDGWRQDHPIDSVTRTMDYKYTGPRPHAASKIVETLPGQTGRDRVYSYDDSGNNTGNTFGGETITQTWDEENRLKQVTRNGGSLAKFLYGPDGDRTHKQTGAGDAFYVNQFFVLQPNKLTTKHIFAGETRIVSKTENISYQVPVVSYYHPDHLGSTSYTSGPDQTLMQHERSFPFGERDFGDQEECDLGRPDNMRREWLFTSKELDWDTGLLYFGARYYDPRTAVWQSPDPSLASYMRGAPNGGVYVPGNLGSYTYTLNNPVVMKDPDGRNWFKINGNYEWHEGSSYRGKTSNFTHFIEFTKTGTNEFGAATGRLRLYEQNKVISEGQVFSGGTDPATGRRHGSIPEGTYTARLDKRDTADSLGDTKPVPGDPEGRRMLLPYNGFQQIAPDREFEEGLDFQYEWGSARLRLTPDKGESGQAFRGNYIHGKAKPEDWTHGCICDRDESVLRSVGDVNGVPRIPVQVKR
jgi:RHS repeat-associated protein